MPVSLRGNAHIVALAALLCACREHARETVAPPGIVHVRPTEAAPPAAPPAPRSFLAVVEAPSTADIASQLDARVLRVYVRAGDHVRRGQVLADLDGRAARKELAMAHAALLAAKADLARARVDAAEANERAARRATKVELSSGELVGTVSDEERAASTYQQKLARVKIDAASAAVVDKRAHFDELRQLAAEGAVRAPFDGLIAQRYIDPGTIAHKGAPIVRMLASGDLRICFAVPESIASRIEVGLPVRIDTEQARLAGHVEKVAPEIDAAARMVFAEASLDEPAAAHLRAGQVAHVQVLAAADASR